MPGPTARAARARRLLRKPSECVRTLRCVFRQHDDVCLPFRAGPCPFPDL